MDQQEAQEGSALGASAAGAPTMMVAAAAAAAGDSSSSGSGTVEVRLIGIMLLDP